MQRLQAKENCQDAAVQRIVGHMEAPCFFGESALLPSIKERETPCRVASVVAANNLGTTAEETEPVQILSLSRDDFTKLIEDGVLDEDASSTTHRAAYETSRARPTTLTEAEAAATAVRMHGGEATPSNATAIVESGLDSKTDEMLMGQAMFQQDEEELVRVHSLCTKEQNLT